MLKTQKRDYNAMIVLEKRRMRVLRHVRPKFIPKESFEVEYKGRWIHLLGLDMQGKFFPITSPTAQAARMPSDLYMAIHCADEVDEVFGLSMPTSTKIGIGILVALCVGILVVVFLMFQSM